MVNVNGRNVNGKNDSIRLSKNLGGTDLKITLLDHQNNYVKILIILKKNFDILTTNLSRP